MKLALLRSRLKPWMLPIAMVTGIFCSPVIDAVAFLAPALIFVMLLITFCKIDTRHFRITRMTWALLAVQVVGALAVYGALLPVNRVLAQGAFICVFCPTATAAPVITGMLGGSVPRLVTYSLVSNVAVALTAPLLFSMMGSDVSFMESAVTIAARVFPLILGPLAVALLLRRTVPGVHGVLARNQGLSFYIWAVSLIIVVGRARSLLAERTLGARRLEGNGHHLKGTHDGVHRQGPPLRHLRRRGDESRQETHRRALVSHGIVVRRQRVCLPADYLGHE